MYDESLQELTLGTCLPHEWESPRPSNPVSVTSWPLIACTWIVGTLPRNLVNSYLIDSACVGSVWHTIVHLASRTPMAGGFTMRLSVPLALNTGPGQHLGLGSPRLPRLLTRELLEPLESADLRSASASSVMATTATWNGKVIAATDAFQTVEGNVYFPRSALKMDFFKPSPTHTTCGWKGVASYYTVEVDGKQNKDAAWYYPDPLPAAAKIKVSSEPGTRAF